jgi:hypothetical protein
MLGNRVNDLARLATQARCRPSATLKKISRARPEGRTHRQRSASRSPR